MVSAAVYQRVLKITMPDGSGGTGFVVEDEGREFLVTAAHVVAGQAGPVTMTLTAYAAEREVTLERLPGVTGDADIAVFSLDEPLTPRMDQVVTPSFDNSFYTQDMYLLGYPFGLGMRRPGVGALPFVKKGILSASLETDGRGHIIYLDATNNPGFSGGPVAFYERQEVNRPHYAAVISGYRVAEQRVVIGGQPIDAVVLENTGIVIAWDIKHAMDAINAV